MTLDDDMEQELSPGSAMGGKKKGRMTQPGGEMAGEDGESVTAGEVINEVSKPAGEHEHAAYLS